MLLPLKKGAMWQVKGMHELKVNLHECKHCSGSGTCKNSKNESSCLACAKKSELPFWRLSNQHGLLCGSYGGIGQAEPLTERINKRVAPLLAIYLITSLLALIFFAPYQRVSSF